MFNKILDFLVIGIGLLTISCGSSSFQSDSRIDKYGEPNLDSREKEGLTWLWECDGTYSQDESTLTGEGNFIVSRSSNITYLRFKGDSCLGSQVSRDIVFVVDVSNSMNYESNGNPASDPVTGSSCGRLDAIEKTVRSLQSRKEDATYSILTFSDRVVDKSSRFFSSQKDLYQDLVSSSTLSSMTKIVCNADGGTDYDIALKGAKSLFDSYARSGSRHEVYFISDGEPWPATSTGEEVAKELRNSGTVIGTVMLAHLDDSVLKNKIASSSASGSKLHANVSKVENLAKALSTLVNADIVKAEIKYKSFRSNDWKSVDVSDKISGSSYDFVTPIKLESKDFSSGLEVIYTYWDAEGNYVELRGQINWKE